MADTPIVVINGARQVGKSTLASAVLEKVGGALVTLDDDVQRNAAREDPRGFVEREIQGVLVIDEVQFVPQLFRAIKAAVDRDRRAGRFLLTGSTRLLSADGFADAVVGRAEVIELWPFSQGEVSAAPEDFVAWAFAERRPPAGDGSFTRAELLARVATGGFPEANARTGRRRSRWFDNYLTTLTEKVIRQVAAIERLAEIPRVIRLCAARSGTELNVTALANELAIPPRTLDGYLTLLANLFVIQLVPAWSTNLSKKVVKRPKLVMVDSGLASHLTLLNAERAADPTTPVGPLVESFVAMELRKQLTWSHEPATMWHFRDRDGAEVDLVLEHADGRVVGIEAKAARSVSSRDAAGLRYLADRLGPRFHHGFLLSCMPEATPLGNRLSAIPIETLWHAPPG